MNGNKKIVYTTTSLGNSGGIERVLVNKANWLVNNGYNVSIITEDMKESFYQIDSRVNILSLNIVKRFSKYSAIRFFIYVVFSICYGFKISRILRELNPDVVISVNARDWVVLPFVNKKFKKIYEFHWIVSKVYPQKNKCLEWMNRKFVKFIGNKYDNIILLTKLDEKRNTNEWNNVVVIPNARTFTCATPAALLKKRAIAVGNLFHVKGFSRLIDAWNIVHKQHPDWCLSIYGDGYLREELQSKIDALALADVVKLEGKVQDIKSEYLQSSFALCSSYEESFSMVTLEAQTCGLPVVAFDCPCGPSEIITDGVDGFMIFDDDVESFAKKVCLLVENETLRKRMGRSAFENSERFAEDEVMARWVEIFNE